MKKKHLIHAAICSLIIAVACFKVMPIGSQTTPQYDPWVDLNDDGKINILDIVKVALIFGTSGTPITKANLAYDSGWIDISNMKGQNIVITPNIGNLDALNYMVRAVGKATEDGAVHRRLLDLTGYKPEGWGATYGEGPFDATVYSMIRTSDGGYALAGAAWVDEIRGFDFWLVKTDENGVCQWDRHYGGTDIEIAYSVIQTSEGGYALAGGTDPFLGGDAWFVKTDANGFPVWNKTYTGVGYDCFYDLVQTSEGGYALAGETTSYGSGLYDVWLVRTNSVGSPLWNATYGLDKNEQAKGLIQEDDGGFVLACYTESFGAGWSDFWLMNTTANGDFVRGVTYGGTGYDNIEDFVQTSDGGYALVGTTTSFGFGIGGSGDKDAWLVKTDPNFNLIWDKTYSRCPRDEVTTLTQTIDGGYAFIGSVAISGQVWYQTWLVKTNEWGDYEWDRTYGGPSAHLGEGLVQTSDGGYTLGGYRMNTDTGVHDAWLIKTDPFGITYYYWYGLSLVGSTADTITFRRGEADPYWNHLRVVLWTMKNP